MATLASSPLPIVFNGRTGNSAPFKADYVSSLVTAVLNAEIDQMLRSKALQDQNSNEGEAESKLNKLIAALRVERNTKTFPYSNLFGDKKPSNVKIGIVGGGMAGLYAAHILQTLQVDYEVLEANKDRLGGRIYTHYFSEPPPGSDKPNHDYYDIGAMRFPNSPIMARTFDLFRRLDMGEPGKPHQRNNVLIPYYMTGRNCPTRYNDISAYLGRNEKERFIDPKTGQETQADPDPITQDIDDPFHVSTDNGGTVPATRVSHKITTEILNDAYDRFRQKIKTAHILTTKAKAAEPDGKGPLTKASNEARQRAYEYLMRHDKFSLREYLQNVEGYDPDTVHWLETTDSASGWYDMAFTENVFESLAFCYSDASNQSKDIKQSKDTKQSKDDVEEATKWWCIEGGSSIITKRFQERLDESKIFQDKAVTKMVLKNAEGDIQMQKSVAVTMRDHKGAEETRTYSAVINTTTLGALQKIDLTDMEIPYGMKSAIRILRYDTSTKVGIRFKKMWWMQKNLDKDFDINLGGVAKTDLPIRVCVYPSYNIHDDPEEPGVLLASYTWGQDSERIASHVSTTSPEGDKGLRELMVYNLARLHTLKREDETPQDREERFLRNKQTIDSLWDTHHAFDWSKDEFSSGAFALFSPGQFSTLIPHLVRPASDGRFVIVGEHASANHAWIVGALDSALRGLKQIFTRLGMNAELDEMIRQFGDVDELKQEQVAKQVIISMLTEKEMAELRLGRPILATAQVAQGSM
ncbi:hypothetical protein ACN47E_006870 [Coniothyrium glycines]